MRKGNKKNRAQALFVALGLLLLTACSQVYFPAPQPEKGKPMASFPKIMQGTYSNESLSVEIKGDAVLINGIPFPMTRELPSKGQVQIRFSNNLYFANFSDSVYYSVIMAQFYEDKLALFMLNPDKQSVSILQRFVPTKEITLHGKKSVLVAPVKNDFYTLVDNDLWEAICVLKKE
jgi:hypothetical protein